MLADEHGITFESVSGGFGYVIDDLDSCSCGSSTNIWEGDVMKAVVISPSKVKNIHRLLQFGVGWANWASWVICG